MAGQTIQTTIAINATVGNGFSKAGAALTELGSLVNGVSQQVIEFGKDSVGVYREYEMSMADAEVALSTTYGRGTQQLNTVMTQLDTAATQWAATTIFHTDDVANAIAEAAHAGWDFDQIMSGIPAAIELAQAGGIDLSEAVNYIVKSTSAAGISFQDLGNFIDLWAFAANSSATNIDEMGEAMLRMGSTMRFATNPEELLTLIAVTANAGTVGSSAGTLIRNSMMRLIAPTDKAKEAMGELGATSEETAEIMNDEKLAAANARLEAAGFSAYDENGNLKSVLDTYRELYVALGEIAGGYENIETNDDTMGILSAIFPMRSISEALTLLRGVSNDFDGLYEQMMSGAAEGYGQYAAETMMDTLNGRIETFESKVERLKQLVGGELAEPLGNLLGTLGGIVDSISGLDDVSFSTLVGGLEGIAAVGPGLLAAGGALRFVGLFAANPALVGGALGVAALAAGLGALDAYKDVQFSANFGQLELDLTTLKQNVDGLTTDTETSLAELQSYTDEVTRLAGQYKTAMTDFSTEITMATLTGKTLNADERNQIVEYGESVREALFEGINAKQDESEAFFGEILGDEGTEEDYEAYSGIMGDLEAYFGDLRGQAMRLGMGLQQAILDSLNNDGVIDEYEREVIQSYVDMMNEIEAEIAAQTAQSEYYTALAKSGRISLDDLEEYMEYLSQNHEERTGAINDQFDKEEGVARSAYEYNHGLEPGSLTDDQWHETPSYKFIQNRRDKALKEIEEQTGQLANTAFDSAMHDSEFGDSWDILNKAVAEAQVDENGNVDYANIDWSKYLTEDQMPKFLEDLSTIEEKGGFLGLFGDNRLSNLIETWKDTFGLSDDYDMLTSGINEAHASAAEYNAAGRWQENAGPEAQTETVQVTPEMDTSQLEGGTATVEVEPEVDASTVSSEIQSAAGGAVPISIEGFKEGENPIEALRNQDVDVQINGDDQQLSATINGWDGYLLTEHISGDATNLSMTIQDQNGKTLRENVTGDASQLAAAIQQYNGQTITVNIKGNKMFSVPGAGGGTGYAEGGRATEASIFGEAGPEWAIPEEHSESTARLLDAARAASGFTWPELLARNGGLNAGGSGGNRTLVYAPTIYAQDADGVDEVLQQNKEDMDKWYREKEMRDEMEVYA